MATKFVYSDSEVQEIMTQYSLGVSLDSIAMAYNKSVPSVRMKLVKLGVYQKPVKTAVAKTKVATAEKSAPTTKAEVQQLFARAMQLGGPALM